jgi:divalent metal cation (Fe/Co/Zn/Cd) transporter
VHEAGGFRQGASWSRFLRSTKQPELAVVLLEDMGALVGLAFALVGVTMAVVTGNGRWDGAGSLAIGVLLVLIATFLAQKMASLLLGESASPESIAAIRGALEASADVERVIHLRTMHLGPDELLVGAKIAVNHDNTATGVARAIDAAEARVREAVPIAHLIYLEPDIDRVDRADSVDRTSA